MFLDKYYRQTYSQRNKWTAIENETNNKALGLLIYSDPSMYLIVEIFIISHKQYLPRG